MSTTTAAEQFQATLQARELRMRYGISYNAIAAVMEHYHGVVATGDQWQGRLRKTGCPPKPHGRPFNYAQ